MPVAPRLDQVCVSRETVMAKLFSERIIIAKALLIACGGGPSNRETAAIHRGSRFLHFVNLICGLQSSRSSPVADNVHL